MPKRSKNWIEVRRSEMNEWTIVANGFAATLIAGAFALSIIGLSWLWAGFTFR